MKTESFSKQLTELSDRLVSCVNILRLGEPIPGEFLYYKIVNFYQNPTSQPETHVKAVVDIYEILMTMTSLFKIGFNLDTMCIYVPKLRAYFEAPIDLLLRVNEMPFHLEVIHKGLRKGKDGLVFFRFVYTYLIAFCIECAQICKQVAQVINSNPINLEA